MLQAGESSLGICCPATLMLREAVQVFENVMAYRTPRQRRSTARYSNKDSAVSKVRLAAVARLNLLARLHHLGIWLT